jgi:hypothetical protein
MRRPVLHILRTRYPDLAGVLLRDWTREGLLAAYHYHRAGGFYLVGVRPRWRWVVRLVFGWRLGQWGRLASGAPLVWRRQGGGR